MRRAQALQIIAANKDKLKDFSVKSLAIFGSVARDEATDASDVDILVEFIEDAPIGLFEVLDLKYFLEEKLGCAVDLGTPDSLRKELSAQVLKEAIHAA
jgi:predicted nucleotidyltransferase